MALATFLLIVCTVYSSRKQVSVPCYCQDRVCQSTIVLQATPFNLNRKRVLYTVAMHAPFPHSTLKHELYSLVPTLSHPAFHCCKAGRGYELHILAIGASVGQFESYGDIWPGELVDDKSRKEPVWFVMIKGKKWKATENTRVSEHGLSLDD